MISSPKLSISAERIDGAILQGHFYYDGFVIGRRCDGVVVVVDKGLKSAAPAISGNTITGSGTVYYTTDGSDPRYSATRKVYSAAIEGAEVIKAVAYEEGKFVSDVVEN